MIHSLPHSLPSPSHSLPDPGKNVSTYCTGMLERWAPLSSVGSPHNLQAKLCSCHQINNTKHLK